MSYPGPQTSIKRGYELPHPKAPSAREDVKRILNALIAIDIDVGALLQSLSGKIEQAQLDALESKLLGGAGPAIDTLKELATLIADNDTDIAAFTAALGGKADKSQLATQMDAAMGGTSWREVNTGPKGADGTKGDRGPKGDKGDKGDRGATGPHGSTVGLVQDVRRTRPVFWGSYVWQKKVNDSWVTFHTEPSNYN